ncbi:MAG TPA: cyclic nucleotide-binding domain-containing protein [Gammaproteobacteria bacterium]|jgi:cGMP-dependent protein kinase
MPAKIDVAALRKVPIFSSMSDAELNAIAGAPENGLETYETKALIIREMEVAQCMYVILEGSVEVSLRGEDNFGREVVIATLRAGDFFGEQALVSDKTTTGRRSASVRCQVPAKLFRIDKKYVKLGVKRDRLGSEDQTITRMSVKDKEVRDLVKSMRLFQSLTEPELSNIGSWTEVIKVGPGDFVIKESERGDCLYVVLEGSVEIFTLDDDGKVNILATHGKGNYFGEQALMPGSSGVRSAYARSNGIARLVKVPKEYFRLILNRDSEVARSLLKSGLDQKKQRDTLHKGK